MNILHKIAQLPFVRSAMEDKADLRSFGKKPSKRVMLGLVIIVISYVLGWPAVGVLGALSFSYDEPELVVVGGPLIYGLSYVVLFLGVYLAGGQYSKTFFRWAIRVTMEKFMNRR